MNHVWQKLNTYWRAIVVCWLAMRALVYLHSVLPPAIWPLIVLTGINLGGYFVFRFTLNRALRIAANWGASL